MALLALLTACAGSPGPAVTPRPPTESASDPAAGGGIAQADNDLQVELDPATAPSRRPGRSPASASWRARTPTPEAACEHLKGMDDPFAPLPADVVCTEQFGGPQTAHVLGRWNGEPVDLELSRTDGCRISQWDSLGPLLPGPVG